MWWVGCLVVGSLLGGVALFVLSRWASTGSDDEPEQKPATVAEHP